MEIMGHECYVSLEVAKLLKQLGFDWECRRVYCNWGSFTNDGCIEDNEVGPYNWNGSGIAEQYSAPTLDAAQKWVREVEGIFVCVIPEIKDYHATWIFYICDAQCMLYEDDDCFLTYEEALEAGIKKVLEIILKN